MTACQGSQCGCREKVDFSPAFFLCSLLFSDPKDPGYFAQLKDLYNSGKLSSLLKSYDDQHSTYIFKELTEYSQQETKQRNILSEYEQIFLQETTSEFSPYLSDLLRSRGLQAAYLQDVEKLHAKYNFVSNDSGVENIDHLSIFFEFYTTLSMRSHVLQTISEADSKKIEEVIRDRQLLLAELLNPAISIMSNSSSVRGSNFFKHIFDLALYIINEEIYSLNTQLDQIS